MGVPLYDGKVFTAKNACFLPGVMVNKVPHPELWLNNAINKPADD